MTKGLLHWSVLVKSFECLVLAHLKKATANLLDPLSGKQVCLSSKQVCGWCSPHWTSLHPAAGSCLWTSAPCSTQSSLTSCAPSCPSSVHLLPNASGLTASWLIGHICLKDSEHWRPPGTCPLHYSSPCTQINALWWKQKWSCSCGDLQIAGNHHLSGPDVGGKHHPHSQEGPVSWEGTGLTQEPLIQVYTAVTESILCISVPVWYGATTKHDQTTLQWTWRTVERIICLFQELYTSRTQKRQHLQGRHSLWTWTAGTAALWQEI